MGHGSSLFSRKCLCHPQQAVRRGKLATSSHRLVWVFFSTIRKKKAPACINVFYKSQLLDSTKCYFVVCFREILVICFCNLHKSTRHNIFEGSEEMTGTFQGNQSHKIKIVQLRSFQSIFPERHDRTFPWYDI